MSTEQLLVYVIGGIGAVWGLFQLSVRVLLPKWAEAKFKADEERYKADEYERARAAFREDKAFEMLEVTLSEEREETRLLITHIGNMGHNVDRMAHNIDRLTDMIRLLVQQVSVLNDRLGDVERKMGDN